MDVSQKRRPKRQWCALPVPAPETRVGCIVSLWNVTASRLGLAGWDQAGINSFIPMDSFRDRHIPAMIPAAGVYTVRRSSRICAGSLVRVAPLPVYDVELWRESGCQGVKGRHYVKRQNHVV